MAHGDVTHIEIPVSDMAKAKEFYSGLFGWQIEEAPGYEGYPMWRAPNQVSGGALMSRDGEVTQPRSIIEVDSIDDTIAAAVAAGASVGQEKQPVSATSWWAEIIDPDGNRIGLYEGTMEGEGS